MAYDPKQVAGKAIDPSMKNNTDATRKQGDFSESQGPEKRVWKELPPDSRVAPMNSMKPDLEKEIGEDSSNSREG